MRPTSASGCALRRCSGSSRSTSCREPRSRHWSTAAEMRVVVADDSLLFRDGLVRVLQAHGFDVVAETDNAEDLVRRTGGLRPDVVLVDMRMPPSHTDEGLQAALRIRREHP